jgi:1,4-alpha-glucan branching enzyme
MEWLHEAAAETYLPLLRVLGNLERDNIRFNCNLNLSPILLEQLSHPVFIAEFPNYLDAQDRRRTRRRGLLPSVREHVHLAETARFWQRFFSLALEDFNHLDRNIIAGFRHFNDIGLIDIITCGATHGYMPLLGTDESVRAQIRTAVDTHDPSHRTSPPRHMGP